MFIQIPTYKVTLIGEGNEDNPDEVWRVPQTDLEPFIHVLMFNNRYPFTVSCDDPPGADQVQQIAESIRDGRG